MSSFYPDYALHLDFEEPSHSQTPMNDQWRQHRGQLDPINSPSSPFPPVLGFVSSPTTPRGSPNVTKKLNKFGDLALDNGQSNSSDISPNLTGSPLHQPLFDESNSTHRVGNVQLLGPSITRRSQALSTDNFHDEHRMSMSPHKHDLEHRSAHPRSQGSHRLSDSNPHVPPIPTPPNILLFDAYGTTNFPPDFDLDFDFLNDFEPTPAGIMVSANTSTANAAKDEPFAVGFPSHLAVPQFDTSCLLPLTDPHVLDCYSQQAPHAPVEQIAGGSESKHSDPMAKVLKCYYEHFKHSQSILRICEKQFKKEVGSLKTVQASLGKRKDEGHWTCPLECSDFTRKQNLKHHLQSHLGIKDFPCTCGTAFNALSGLKRHQKKCRLHIKSHAT